MGSFIGFSKKNATTMRLICWWPSCFLLFFNSSKSFQNEAECSFAKHMNNWYKTCEAAFANLPSPHFHFPLDFTVQIGFNVPPFNKSTR